MTDLLCANCIESFYEHTPKQIDYCLYELSLNSSINKNR